MKQSPNAIRMEREAVRYGYLSHTVGLIEWYSGADPLFIDESAPSVGSARATAARMIRNLRAEGYRVRTRPESEGWDAFRSDETPLYLFLSGSHLS